MSQLNNEFATLNPNNDVNKSLQEIFNAIQVGNLTSKKNHQEFLEKYDKIDKKLTDIEKRQDTFEENQSSIINQILNVKADLNNVKQSAIENNVIVRGLPAVEKNSDDLKVLLNSFFNSLSITFDSSEINSVKRIGKETSTDLNKPICVKFVDKTHKQKLFDAKKKQPNLTCDQILHHNFPLGSKDQKVFVDDELTKFNQELFRKARQLKKHGQVKYVWYRNGKILLREKEDSPAVRIRHEGDLGAIQSLLGEDLVIREVKEADTNSETSSTSGRYKRKPTSPKYNEARRLRSATLK